MLRRLSNPIWFQAFGSVVGFDWHSSGLTTVLCGALKEGLRDRQGELGLFLAGGKGKASRKTPYEIRYAGEKYGLSNDLSNLKRISKLVAKVDSSAVQDGYQLYHHFFVFDKAGNWSVVQQGMNEEAKFARRYHWLSEGLASCVDDPHQGICGKPEGNVLNLVAHNNVATRTASVELCSEPPKSHPIPSPGYLNKILYKIYDKPPESYEGLLELPGVGASTLCALAMVAEITHGTKPTFQDPVRYAFAHGGKDAFPFPVNKEDIQHSLDIMKSALSKAKLGNTDKMKLAFQEKQLEIKNMPPFTAVMGGFCYAVIRLILSKLTFSRILA